MPNFIDDNTPLAFPKESLRAAPFGSASKYIRAEDWNAVCQALYDCRTAILDLVGGGLTDGDKGDIVVSASGATWTIDTNVVSLTKLAQIATGSFLGRVSASTGNVEVLTGTQATALLDTFTTSAKGLVPAASGGNTTTEFLRKDGSFAVPGDGASSLVIADMGAAPSKNLSSEGTLDWFALVTSQTSLTSQTTNNHWKYGGDMWSTYAATTKGQTGAAATFTAQQTTTSNDTAAQTALTNNTAGSEYNTVNSFSATAQFGFGWSAPSSGLTRVMRINLAVTNAQATLTCWLDDGTSDSLMIDGGNGTTAEKEIKITYKGAARLHVRWIVTAYPYAGTKRIKLQNVTLALT